MFFVYILQSISDKSYYIGCTENLKKRFTEHNKGLSKYTRNKRPWEVLYFERFSLLSQARKREKQIKSWKKRSAIEKLIHAPVV